MKEKVPQPQKANKTSFKEGNVPKHKRSFVDAEEMMENVLTASYDSRCLSFQSAIIKAGYRPSVIYNIFNNYPELEDYKKDAMANIIERINEGALEGDYNATASIWRMKQLGERDEKHTDITTKGNSVTITPIQFGD